MNTSLDRDDGVGRVCLGWTKAAGGAFATGVALALTYLLAIRPWAS